MAAEASIADDFDRLLWHSGLVQTPPDAKSFSRGEVLGRPVEGDGCLANVDKQKWKALSKNDRRRALKVMGTYAWVYFRVSKVFVTDGAWTLASIERNGRVDEGN